jgi:hypothetical protein
VEVEKGSSPASARGTHKGLAQSPLWPVFARGRSSSWLSTSVSGVRLPGGRGPMTCRSAGVRGPAGLPRDLPFRSPGRRVSPCSCAGVDLARSDAGGPRRHGPRGGGKSQRLKETPGVCRAAPGPGGLCGVAGTEAARVGGGVQDEVGPLDRPGRRRGPARDRRRCGARARVLSWPRSRSTRTARAPSVPLLPMTTAMLTRVTTSPCRPSGNLRTARRHGQVQVVPPLPPENRGPRARGVRGRRAHIFFRELPTTPAPRWR